MELMSLTSVWVPLIDSAIHATGHQLIIIRAPEKASDLAVVCLEGVDVFKACCRKELNVVTLDSCKEVATIAEGTLRKEQKNSHMEQMISLKRLG